LVAPCVGKLWEAVQKDDTRSSAALEASLQGMEYYLIVGVNPARTNPAWKSRFAIVDAGIFVQGGLPDRARGSNGVPREKKQAACQEAAPRCTAELSRH